MPTRDTTSARLADLLPPEAGGRVLVVDDLPSNLDLVRALLERDGHCVRRALSGEGALDLVRDDPPDLILLDVRLPGRDGFEICRVLKSNPLTRLVPVVLVTALRAASDRLQGLEAGADDFITKPFSVHELSARVRSLIRIKRTTDDLESADALIVSLALTVEARDPTTDGHCQRLAAYAEAMGGHLGLSAEERSTLQRGAFLHDVGKIGVPDAVLLKAGPLTAEEFALVKTHTTIGDRICGELRSLRRVRSIVRWHHERIDGSGYPDGLKGDAIPLLSQVLSVADVFDALTSARPYKRPMPADTAYEVMTDYVRRGWHRRDLVDAFIGLASAAGWPRQREVRSER
jgi:putative two-component system response regulator